MERILQVLDDLEDLYFAVPLLYERWRRFVGRAVRLAAICAILPVGIYIAVTAPLMGLATATVAVVALLYSVVTTRSPKTAITQA